MGACDCGNRDHDDSAQFCSACGDALGDTSGLLGVSTPRTLTTTSSVGSSAIDWRWLAAALVVTVGLIAWSANSSRSDDESAAVEESAAIEQANSSTPSDPPPATEPTTTMRSVTTAAPSTQARSTDQAARGVGATTVAPIGNGASLFDEPIGFKLIATTSNRLVVIDPDAATVTSASEPSSSIEPIATVGDWLLFGDGTVSKVPLNALAAEPVDLSPGATSMSSLSLPIGTDGTIWVQQFQPRSGWPQFVRFDIDSGVELDRIELVDPPARITAFAPPVADSSMLLGASAGGTYAYENGEYRRMTESHLVTAGVDQVLVARCDDRLNCTSEWLDRETWEPTQRLAPPQPFDQVDIVEGTDWVVLTSFSLNGSRLYNTTSGQLAELRDRFIGTDWQNTIAISPDGRWMTTRTGLSIEVTNLETGEERMIEGVPTGGRVIFTDASPTFGVE